GRHAREVARASGGIFAQAQVKFGSSSLGWGYQIGHQRSGIVDASGATILRRNPPPSTTQADLDDLTLPDRSLVRAAARLLNGVFQAFGVAEARQYSEDGFVWRDGWSADWRLSVEQ